MKKLLLIDNYDSFVFNLARALVEAGAKVEVVRNDALSVHEITPANFSALIISPGPCGPLQAGVSCPAIVQASKTMPILGVCLGHQCIAEVYGLKVAPSGEPVHGMASEIFHSEGSLCNGIPNPFPAGRYHALTVERPSPDHVLRAVAETANGQVMALEHKTLPIYGVQFHPESILTPHGEKLLASFITITRKHQGGNVQ
jgi:anthranilate synthase/aminodeoxychorismate synthase-like glutamine amidotransferase